MCIRDRVWHLFIIQVIFPFHYIRTSFGLCRHHPFQKTKKNYHSHAIHTKYKKIQYTASFKCGLFQQSTTVSYTHLDVYKRQEVDTERNSKNFQRLSSLVWDGLFIGRDFGVNITVDIWESSIQDKQAILWRTMTHSVGET